jgi:hypothetical protein
MRGLAREDDRAREPVVGAVADAVPQRDRVEEVEVLALVLVDPLALRVEQRGRIAGEAVRLAQPRGELLLVRLLDRAPALLERGIVGVGLELAEPLEIA